MEISGRLSTEGTNAVVRTGTSLLYAAGETGPILGNQTIDDDGRAEMTDALDEYTGRHRRGADAGDRLPSMWAAPPSSATFDSLHGVGRHIGRVGALAVALGIGAAMAASPGIAHAGPAGTGTASANTADSAPADNAAGTSKPETTKHHSTRPTTKHDTGDPAADVHEEGAVAKPHTNNRKVRPPRGTGSDTPIRRSTAPVPARQRVHAEAETPKPPATERDTEPSTAEPVDREMTPRAVPVNLVSALPANPVGSSRTGDPTAPLQTAATWTLLAAARRELGGSAKRRTTAVTAEATASAAAEPAGGTPVASLLAVNEPPAPVGTPTITHVDQATGAVTGQVVFNDPDGDTVFYGRTAVETNTKGDFSINLTTGVFVYTPNDYSRLIAGLTNATPSDKSDGFLIQAFDGHGGVSAPVSVAVPVTSAVGATDIFVGDIPPTAVHTFGYQGIDSVILSKDGSKLFALRHNPGTTASNVSLLTIDTATHVVTSQTVLDGVSSESNVHGVLSTSGSHLYVISNGVYARIAAIDTATGALQVVFGLTVSGTYSQTAPDGTTFTAQYGNDGNGVLFTKSEAGATTEQTMVYPDANRALGSNGSTLYSTTFGGLLITDTSLPAANPSRYHIVSSPAGSQITTITAAPTGNRAYVTFKDASGNGTFTVLDSTGTTISTAAVGKSPSAVAVGSNGQIYVANAGDGTISVIDAANGAIVGTPLAIASPTYYSLVGLAMDADATTLFIARTGTTGNEAPYVTISPIVPVNHAPTFDSSQPPSSATSTGVVSGLLLANDPDGDGLTYSGDITTAKGIVDVNEMTGQYTYTPTGQAKHDAAAESADPAVGVDSFVVTVSDGNGGLDTHTVSVNIVPANQNPVQTQAPTGHLLDSTTGAINGTVHFSDPDGDILTYSGDGATPHGVVDVDEDTGQYVYTPVGNIFDPGTDTSFTITVHDGHGGTVDVEVPVAISAQNGDPFITGTTVTYLDHLVYGTTQIQVSATDPDGDALRYTIDPAGVPAYGHADIDDTGRLTYTPDGLYRDRANIQETSGGGSLIDHVTVTVDDGNGGTDTTVIAVTVDPWPGPIITGVTVVSVDHSTGTTVFLLHATNPTGETLHYFLYGHVASERTQYGEVISLTDDGYLTYTPTTSQSDPTLDTRHFAAGYWGAFADSVGVAVTTDSTTSHGSPVSLLVDPANAEPSVAGDPDDPDPDGTVLVHVESNDTDDDHLTFHLSDPAYGSAVFTGGNVRYTPTEEARHDAAGDGSTTDTFTITVDDGHGGQGTATVTVAILPANTPPEFYADQDEPMPGNGVVLTGDLVAHDDDGDTLTYSVPSTTGNGHVDIDSATGHYTYTPHDDHVISDGFTVTVDDGHGGTATYDVDIDIEPVNHPPTIDTTSPTDPATGNGKVRFEVIVDDPDDDGLHLTFGSPANGSLRFDDGTGEYVYTPTDAARHAAATESGTKTDSFTITVDDGRGGTASTTVTVGIGPVNRDPVFDATQSTPDVSADGVVTGPLHATDPDNDTLTYTVVTGPVKGSVQVVGGTGQFTYTPTAAARHAAAKIGAGNDITTDTFTVSVADGHGGTDTYTVRVAIDPANSVPVYASDQAKQSTVKDTGVITGRAVYYDADGDPLTYVVGSGSGVRFALASAPALGSVTVDPITGSYTYTPTTDALSTGGADSFTIVASDGYLGTASPTTIDVSIPALGAGPVSPAIPLGGSGGGGVAGVLPPAWTPATATSTEVAGAREQTDEKPGGSEYGEQGQDSTAHAAELAGRTAAAKVPSAPVAHSPGQSTAELPSQRGEPDATETEVSLTNMVESGTQGMIISLVLLVIGGWVFTRRVLES